MFSDRFLTDFVTLLVVVNPIGKLPVFLAATAGVEAVRRDRIADRAALISFGVLLFFLVFGQLLLNAMGVGLASFRLAGSLVLLLFALSMVFDNAGKPSFDENRAVSDTERAIFPIAIPAIAGPGTMLAVVVLTDNDVFSMAEQAETAGTLALVLGIAWVCMRGAGAILAVIRPAGASIVGRVMGLILASLAVEGMVQSMTSIVRRAFA